MLPFPGRATVATNFTPGFRVPIVAREKIVLERDFRCRRPDEHDHAREKREDVADPFVPQGINHRLSNVYLVNWHECRLKSPLVGIQYMTARSGLVLQKTHWRTVALNVSPRLA